MSSTTKTHLPDSSLIPTTALLAGLLAWVCCLPVLPARAAASASETTEVRREGGETSPTLRAASTFAQGKLLEDRGDLEGAMKAYEAALALDDSDPYAFLEVAKLHIYLAQISNSERRLGHLETAADHAANARRLAPENLDILGHFAQTHLRLVEQNQFDSLAIATEAYEELRERQEDPDLQVLTSLGQLYLWQRKDQAAAEVLREASALRPGFTMLQRMLVEALLGAGESSEAETVLDELIELEPENHEHRGRLAELRSQRGDHRGAVELLRDSPPELLADPRMRRLLARELHLAGENDEALAIADTLLLDSEGSGRLRRLRIAIFSALARYEDAADELRPLLAQTDDPEQALNDHLLMARLLERLGRDGEAAGMLQQVLAEGLATDQRQRHQAVMALIGLYERQGMHDAALDLMRRQVEEGDPEEAVAFGRVTASFLAGRDRFDEALEALAEAGRRLPVEDPQNEALALQRLTVLENAERWDALGREARSLRDSTSTELRDASILAEAESLAARDQLDAALDLLADAEADAPDRSRRFQALRLDLLLRAERLEQARPELESLAAAGLNEAFFAAQIYQQHEYYEESIPLLERLVEETEDPRRPLFLLGAAHERSGDRGVAITTFEKLLDRDPDYLPALNYLGYMLAEKGEQLERAYGLIRRAVASDPDNGAYVDSLGWTLFQLGRYEEALQHLEWAALLLPDDPTILEHLGDVLAVLGQQERAEEAYARALSLGADDPEKLRGKLDALEQEGP